MTVKKNSKILLTVSVILVLLAAVTGGGWYLFIRTNYKMAVNQYIIGPNIPIADISEWDMTFITDEIEFWNDDGSYDIFSLERKMGLYVPYEYYTEKYPIEEPTMEDIRQMTDSELQAYISGENVWIKCDIADYDRQWITLRYYGTNGDISLDDTWRINISEVRKGGNAKVYLNDNEYMI